MDIQGSLSDKAKLDFVLAFFQARVRTVVLDDVKITPFHFPDKAGFIQRSCFPYAMKADQQYVANLTSMDVGSLSCLYCREC